MRLPPDTQTTCDLLSPEAKHVILEHKHQRQPSQRPLLRSAQLHELTLHDLNHMTARDLLEIQIHDTRMGRVDVNVMATNETSQISKQISFVDPDNPISGTQTTSDNMLLAHVTKRTPLPPGDVTRLLSNTMNGLPAPMKSSETKDIQVNGKTYREVSMAKILYIATNHCTA
jgi:hypothetical protein